MTLFVLLAAAMLAVALAFSLLPLLRRRGKIETTREGDTRRLNALRDALDAGVLSEEEYRSKLNAMDAAIVSAATTPNRRPAMLASLLVALLLPAAAVVLYQFAGEPAALDPANLVPGGSTPSAAADPATQGIEMDEAVAGLVAKLEANPDNAEGWALLGRAYQAMGKFAESRDALKRAIRLEPNNPDLTVEYAQALALSVDGRRIAGESRQLIEGVLKADPDHQRALWLIGISDYQAANYNAAIAAWNRLLPALPPESDIARSVRAQIADAQQLGGASPSGATTQAVLAVEETAEPANAGSDTGTSPRLTIEVSLDDSLKDKLKSGSTVFVFARAESGPPMPLAIQRLSASSLPATVTLDDSMGMMPSMKLSMFPKVVIGARISASGNAMAQPGDLQVLSDGIDVNRTEPLTLIINSVVP